MDVTCDAEFVVAHLSSLWIEDHSW